MTHACHNLEASTNSHQTECIPSTNFDLPTSAENTNCPYWPSIIREISANEFPQAANDDRRTSYTGQTYDAESGLYYYNARYYNPELGRFIQADTIVPDAKNLQAHNRYSYTENNPLKYVDPSGHGFWSWFKKIAGAFFGALIKILITAATAGMGAGVILSVAMGGLIGGVVGGGISGGVKGALLGALFGAIGAGLGAAANLGMVAMEISKQARTAIFIGVGASLSYATGGWKGLITFAAAMVGAYVGSAIGNSITSVSGEKGGSPASHNNDAADEQLTGSFPRDPVDNMGLRSSSSNPDIGEFGWVRNGGSKFHAGYDILGEKGANVYAVDDGQVTYAGGINGYGNTVIIQHSASSNGINTLYAHLTSITDSIRVGSPISSGTVLGTIGNTGNAAGTPMHLHFGVFTSTGIGVNIVGHIWQNPGNFIKTY